MSDEFEDDGIFFAGIGAEDVEDAVVEDEDALLADTKVRPDDDQPGGPGMMPMLGGGAAAGGAGAVGLGAYASGTREESRSRSGVNAPVGGTVVSFPHAPDQAHGAVDADGRVRGDDPWGVASAEDLPEAWTSSNNDEAPRTRGGSGTRGSHLARSEGSGTGAMLPGATMGGIGGMQGGQQVAATAASGSQHGGIPLSVLQNLQSGKASGAAFSPMTSGVSAAGSTAYGDPALLVSQALAAGGADGVGTSEDWLREQFRLQAERESGTGGISGISPGLDPEDPTGDGADEDGADGEASPGGRRGARAVAAGAVGVVGAGGIGGWQQGSPTSSGQAPKAPGETGTGTGVGTPTQSSWGRETGSGTTRPDGFTGTTATPGTDLPSGTGFTPVTGGTPSVGLQGVGPATGGAWAPGATGGGVVRPTGGGASGAVVSGPTPTAAGTDFTVSQDALHRDAEQWRRLAVEMDEVHTATRAIRDGQSSFGLVHEPALAYSRTTYQTQRWAAQAAHAYEELADQLQATAALYRSNEQSAIDGTGRVFEA